jgi:Zn-dependent peptidase ImmA (M78 family)
MAKQYRRPLVTFYLPGPPTRGDRGEDFRTLPENRSVAADALLDALIRDVKARQAVVRSLAEDDDESVPLSFVGRSSMQDGVEAVLASIRSTLSIEIMDYRRQGNAGDAFSYLRKKAEDAGIFVLLIGDLGSHHSAIAVETFRGFAIADKFAPFVIINDQDAKTAWSFTLLHEIAHLWLGTTGVSSTSTEKAIERFCNEVASRFLLPLGELAALKLGDSNKSDELIQIISSFSSARHLSRKMVAYGLFRSGRISVETWSRIDRMLDELWRKEKKAQKDQEKLKSGGPSYYVVRRYHLGQALLNFVNRSLEAGTLTPVKAAKVLGVKPRSVYPLLMDR